MNTSEDFRSALRNLATQQPDEDRSFYLGREFNHLPWNVRQRIAVGEGFLAVETPARDMLVAALTADQGDRIRRGMAFLTADESPREP